MDHGITKPEKGIENVDLIMEQVEDYVDAFILHKGAIKHSRHVQRSEKALIVHLSASTSLSSDPNDKRIVTSVRKAVELGGDAVSIHINVGSKTEVRQIEEGGRIAEICDSYGMPLLAMMYPRGSVNVSVETVKHAVRIGYELGADIIKTSFVDSFSEVVEVVPIPVVVAGGSKTGELDLLKDVEKAMLYGAAGVAVGRNVFQSKNPRNIARALHMIVHERMEAEEVWRLIYERGLALS
jgi:predicted phospho-2-dehydro-3-deoxyheptonate aldolase